MTEPFSVVGVTKGKSVKYEPGFVPGKFGKAMDIARGGAVEYRRAGHIEELAGTVDFWFKTKFPGNERRGMWLREK